MALLSDRILCIPDLNVLTALKTKSSELTIEDSVCCRYLSKALTGHSLELIRDT